MSSQRERWIQKEKGRRKKKTFVPSEFRVEKNQKKTNAFKKQNTFLSLGHNKQWTTKKVIKIE